MILGITGAFGCGKSATLTTFSARGWHTFDADRLCHELYAEPGGVLAREFAARWGERVLTQEGTVDRHRLGAIVFSDETELNFLTSKLYPELSRKLDDRIASCRESGEDGAFELPLLFETGWEDKFDRIAAIWSAPEIRHTRLREQRNFSEEEIHLREARQFSADAKLERADFGLINNDGLAELERQIDRLIQILHKYEHPRETTNFLHRP